MTTNELLKLNSEIVRIKEMDFYKYHTFLNHLNEIFEKHVDHSEEINEVILLFTREVIQRFSETYGVKHLPETVRKTAQELIIDKEWHFN